MKQAKPDPHPDLNAKTGVKTLHVLPLPSKPRDSAMHGQTEPTPGRDQVREDTHSTRSPRESKRPIERSAKNGKH